MTGRIRKALGDLKARQDGGKHMPCPRCGRDTMKECVHTNALSRHANIYICDACGTEEALLKFLSNPLPVTEWAYLRPVQRPSDFKTLTAEAIWERVQDTQIPFLMNLYGRWQEEHVYEGFSDYRAAAFERCPGLTALWKHPFRAEYAAKDGKLVLRFRLTDEGIEVAADITK
jgi:predicted RNA-binding Zn-ribbon protein involved in translation (DUF1610 family)